MRVPVFRKSGAVEWREIEGGAPHVLEFAAKHLPQSPVGWLDTKPAFVPPVRCEKHQYSMGPGGPVLTVYIEEGVNAPTPRSVAETYAAAGEGPWRRGT